MRHKVNECDMILYIYIIKYMFQYTLYTFILHAVVAFFLNDLPSGTNISLIVLGPIACKAFEPHACKHLTTINNQMLFDTAHITDAIIKRTNEAR